MHTADFIAISNEIHGHKYDYSQSVYKNKTDKIIIICPQHGAFLQSAFRHLSGANCTQCAIRSSSDTKESFIKKANYKHNNKYDYSKVVYVNKRTIIIIRCPIHGEFHQMPGAHLTGRGCPQCGHNKLLMTTNEFIEKAKLIHGNRYDYSKVKYVNHRIKIEIICLEHGCFHQSPLNHLKGYHCRLCANACSSKKRDMMSVLRQATIIHNGFYDYSAVNYNTQADKVLIRCPKHGMFSQIMAAHLGGKGCRQCSIENNANDLRHTLDSYLVLARKRHGDLYDYSETQYVNSSTLIIIKCRRHGAFAMLPQEHLRTRGGNCPKCCLVVTTGHAEICKLLDDVVDYTINDRSIITPYEIDIFVTSAQLGIEYHGCYWHSYNVPETAKQRNQHSKKHDDALSVGVKLLQFFDFEWQKRTAIVKSMILNHLGRSIPIAARKCTIIDMTSADNKEFFNKNHIQGYRQSKWCFGLRHNNQIVAAMSFSPIANSSIEIIRLANLCEFRVIGGASKLLAYAIKTIKPSTVTTFADRRWSTGQVYKALGFKQVSITKPGYRYLSNNGQLILSRQQCQKHKLSKLLGSGFNANLSESQNMFNNKFRRLWDAGHYKFKLSVNE